MNEYTCITNDLNVYSTYRSHALVRNLDLPSGFLVLLWSCEIHEAVDRLSITMKTPSAMNIYLFRTVSHEDRTDLVVLHQASAQFLQLNYTIWIHFLTGK